MVSVYTINAGTVFAWFMLMMVLRRLVLLIIISVRRRQTTEQVPIDKTIRRGQVEPSTTVVNRIEYTMDKRVNRTIGNDSENDTYFLILLLATAALSDIENGNCIRTIIYAVIYLFFRLFYVVAYLLVLQPWRTLAFFLGFACTLACNLDLVITMSRRAN